MTDAIVLPALREELALLPGPVLADGQPSWTLHDPARNRFFSIDWPTFEVLRRWSFGAIESIVATVNTDTTLQLGDEDVLAVESFLRDNQLLRTTGTGESRRLAERLHKLEGSALNWLLHHYLFFRIPLLRPDARLAQWLPVARLFFSRTFLVATLLALALGFIQVARQWDGFVATLVDTFTWSGIAAYGIALVCVKFLHELGHAFAAKHYGCRVPSMGIAFLVMWPVAYTDTNETWRLTDRWQRLRVASAGIATELVVAAWATLGWALLPDGELRSTLFVLATTSWVATLAINASPFMRFDGYFILSDWLDLPNLHERSFALARWHLREKLFDLREERPEHFRPRRERALILFAWATWLYRLVVFIGIALLVYHFFIKLIGIFLFAVEIAWFIALPVRRELRAWRERWPAIRASRRARISAMLALGVVLLTLLPWPTRVVASGMFRPTEQWPVFAPAGARIEHFDLREGGAVAAGAAIVRFANPELDMRRAAALARVQRLRWQAQTAGFEVESRARLQSAVEELATAEAELAGIDEALARFEPRAPFDGVLRDVDPDLQRGEWVAAHERVALLTARNAYMVETWLDEASIKRIQLHDQGVFISDSGVGPVLDVEVEYIDADATRVLPNPMLAAQAGGHVLTRERDRQLVPEHAMYRVVLTVRQQSDAAPAQTLRGKVVIRARWESPAQRYLRNALAILLRESSL